MRTTTSAITAETLQSWAMQTDEHLAWGDIDGSRASHFRLPTVGAGRSAPWENYEYVVKPKPLRVRVVYEVTTASKASACGGGKFMLAEQRSVVNLRP